MTAWSHAAVVAAARGRGLITDISSDTEVLYISTLYLRPMLPVTITGQIPNSRWASKQQQQQQSSSRTTPSSCPFRAIQSIVEGTDGIDYELVA